ncbi:TPR-like protein [Hyaloscypha bicolor E]|uniref:TPR-like protein n=1 Tax=Hyaloscypha bicolor E TaxID=1095630 RepID=A0A2J6SGJ6_9HELO|nr:TPR-like protein [Hyaloscypha bicolor E]PMD49902.1 TPR-like protein [Hyaloscypha bicolor E]
MKIIVQKMQQRVGKNTAFRVRGQVVEPAKIQRWQKRSGTLDTLTMPNSLPGSSAPSTPSDISYDTVQEIRSPSPYKRNIDSLGGLISELEGNLPPSFPPPQIFDHMPSPQGDLGTDIASILVEDGNVFEGQTPAPFTAPPSPAPSQIHEAHGVSSDSSQHPILGGNLVSSENDIHAPFSSSTAGLAGPQPIKIPQKKHYKHKEELEFTRRLNDLQSNYGSDHPATIDTALRLAQIFEQQGRLRSSESLCKLSAELLQKSVGENDPRTLSAFSQLASIFIFQSQFSKAKTLLQAVHSRASKVLHPSHLVILCIKTTLATCLGTIGNHVEAEQIVREVIVLGKETLPPDHATMVSAMGTLERLLEEQGEYFEAEKMLVVLYETHVLNRYIEGQLQTRSKLSLLWILKGEAQKGMEALREVLAAQKQHFGPEHQDTLLTQQRFAVALQSIGRFVESEELFRDIVNISAKTVGRNHWMTLENEVRLADLFNIRRRFREAEELHKKVLRVSEKVYGWESRLTCFSASSLSATYHRQGRLEEAHSTKEKAFRGYLQILGPNHRKTRDCERGLILLTQEREQLQRSQDGASMSMDPQYGIVVEDAGLASFGISGSGLGGIFQPREGYVGIQH